MLSTFPASSTGETEIKYDPRRIRHGPPHDTAGFEDLTEDEQRILLTEYSLECHREALEIRRASQ